MNHHAPSPAQGLFDAIARSWQLPSPAEAISFSADGRTLAFARRDGAVSLAPTDDPEPPDTRLHVAADTGRATIQKRLRPPTPLIPTEPLASERSLVIAHGRSGFLAVTGTDSLVTISADGFVTPQPIALPGAVTALAQSPSADIAACVSAGRLFLLSEDGSFTEHPAELPSDITALAFSPDGRRLAIGCQERIAVLNLGDATARMIILPAAPLELGWRADGQWLGCALGSAGIALVDLGRGVSTVFADFPTPSLHVSWSEPAHALLASGAFRIAAWSVGEHPIRGRRDGVLVTGHAGLVPVQVVAAHPIKALAAAGYVNGQIVVAPIGSAEELPVKPVGASITALGWSRQGQLVACDADGAVAIMTFPQRLFK